MVYYITRIDAAGESQTTQTGQEDDITFTMWGKGAVAYGASSPWFWVEQRIISTEEILYEFDALEEYKTHEIDNALTCENATDSDELIDIILAFMKRTINAGHSWRIS